MRIETPITKLLRIDLPILQAGMSWASSNVALPLAVSKAGGLGVLAAGPLRPDALAQCIDEIRAGTDRPFGVNMPLYRKGADEILEVLIEKRIPIIIASQGGAARYLERFKAIGTVCIHVVASEEHAVKAMAAGVDALIAVGSEAGGHPPESLVSTMVLTRAVLRATGARIPVVASGGFADGRGLLAALSLGAAGANFGTRFIATPEAGLSEAYKEVLIRAGIADTCTVGKGLGLVRVIRNEFSRGMEALEAVSAALARREAMFAGSTLKMAAIEGDLALGKIEAGQSVGLVTKVMPAADVVQEIANEYCSAVTQLPRGIG